MRHRRLTRPPDPAIRGVTTTYMLVRSHEAVRRLIHLVFRDAHTALDLTAGQSDAFWRAPLPPGLHVVTNNLDTQNRADLHLDFRSTGLPDGAYDLVCYDPPHLADGGKTSIMASRYGTVRGTAALRSLIVAGALEAWRVAAVGLLVKLADHAHGGEHHLLADWVKTAILERPYTVLHTFKSVSLEDRKWKAERVPRNNGAVYLAFRKDGHRHRDFDRLYERQQREQRRSA
jgi:hypothetical protein